MISDREISAAIDQWYPAGGWVRFYANARTRLYRRRFAEIVPSLPKQGRLVDIGCGYGLVANLVSLERPELEIVGIDPDSRRVRGARSTVGTRTTVQFEVADARTYPFHPGDTALFVDVLHHIPYPDQPPLLTRIARTVGTGGGLVIADIAESPRWKYLLTYLVDVLLYPFVTRAQFRTVTNMRKLLQESGWRILEERRTDRRNPFSTILYRCVPSAT